jgi:hypothetical protein
VLVALDRSGIAAERLDEGRRLHSNHRVIWDHISKNSLEAIVESAMRAGRPEAIASLESE